MNPQITVLMPAYNCESFISGAIESVLRQSFSDFELIVLDDGSTDGTLSVAKKFKDPRIKIEQCPHDPIATLNHGFTCVTGKYIARMDADDLIAPDKFAIQYALLEEHPEIDVCGTWMQLFGENGNSQLSKTVAGWVDSPLLLMLRTNFMFNATAMYRSDIINRYELTYQNYIYAEDYLFWSEAARKGAHFFIEAQPLYYYRMWENQVGRKYRKEQVESTWKVKKQITEWLIQDMGNLEIENLYQRTLLLNEKGWLSNDACTKLFYHLFSNICNGRQQIDQD